jgi:hypothetical protein|tara:strand:- start:444 stop:665 length:222 start_codon:yes stop_codon:yes gene_type:complete
MIEIFVQILIGILISAICLRGLWESSVMLSYRSQLRKITGGYYDFEIDEVLAEWGMTREEALKEYGHIYGDKK